VIVDRNGFLFLSTFPLVLYFVPGGWPSMLAAVVLVSLFVVVVALVAVRYATMKVRKRCIRIAKTACLLNRGGGA
jgi:hypothetical protein